MSSFGLDYVCHPLTYRQISGILDLFRPNELEENIVSSTSRDDRQSPKSARAVSAAFNMVLAIGYQCQGSDPSAPALAAHHFAQAQSFAFEGMICDPSLDMVRLFLLMAFYLLTACRRNGAFMYLGIASKAASALGLHRNEQGRSLSRIERSVRSVLLSRRLNGLFKLTSRAECVFGRVSVSWTPSSARYLAAAAVHSPCGQMRLPSLTGTTTRPKRPPTPCTKWQP